MKENYNEKNRTKKQLNENMVQLKQENKELEAKLREKRAQGAA